MDEENPHHWRRDPKLMRYPFVGGACHAVDLLRWIAGDPYEVTAYANQKCLPDWPPVMDATIAIYRFPHKVMGKIFCSIGCKRPYTMRTVLYGTQGTIICDNSSSTIQVFSQQWQPAALNHAEAGFIEVSVRADSHNFGDETDAFVDAIVHDRPLALTASEGARTVAVCLATVDSALKGEPVKVTYLTPCVNRRKAPPPGGSSAASRRHLTTG